MEDLTEIFGIVTGFVTEDIEYEHFYSHKLQGRVVNLWLVKPGDDLIASIIFGNDGMVTFSNKVQTIGNNK